MNAIGPETFHGQHRGTGAGLQYTCNRIAGIMVSSALLACVFCFSKLELILGSNHCVVCESDDGGSCLYCGCYDDLWGATRVVLALRAQGTFVDIVGSRLILTAVLGHAFVFLELTRWMRVFNFSFYVAIW